MTQENRILFRPYRIKDKDICLTIFDANCPNFFAPNERDEYSAFLDAKRKGYEICTVDGQVAGAFGLFDARRKSKNLNWILISPESQGMGLGRAIMDRVIGVGRDSGLHLLSIAASHKSAPFFAKFGAVPITVTPDGWGPGMNRVDMELHLSHK